MKGEIRYIVVSGHSRLDSGGVGTHLRLLLAQLDESGLSYDVVLGGGFLYKLWLIVTRTFAVVAKGLPQDAAFVALPKFIATRLKRLLRRQTAPRTVLLCHDRISAIAAAAARDATESRITIVQTIHAPFYQQFQIAPAYEGSLVRRLAYEIDKATVQIPDAWIAVDSLQRQLLLRDFEKEIAGKPMCTIPNAVERSLLDVPLARRRDKFFLVARHLHEKNGVEYAIRAFALFRSSGGASRDYSLIITGGGPLREDLERLVDELGLASSVVFKGAVDRKVALEHLQRAAASIVPSVPVGDYIEATSLSMLEALALGTPLVASNIGGIKEVLEGTEAALLVEPKDSAALREAMAAVALGGAGIQRMTERGRMLIENGYTTDAWFRSIRDFVESF